MIDEAALPGIGERFELARRAGDLLMNAGYVRIGLDHFARPDDELALTRVRRNFQGYTTDTADTLIGFGASAIGKLPRGYVQNAGSTPEYQRLMDAGGLATARGYQLTREDEVRAFAIERLMCDLEFPALELVNRFGSLRTGFVTFLLPVAALIYGALLLDEALTWSALVGLVLILAGVALGSDLVRARRRESAI